MSELMYRYLEKYVGTYRVKAHFSEETGDFPRDEQGNVDPSFEDLYIECGKGEIRHSYKPYTLVWFASNISQGRNMKRTLESEHRVKSDDILSDGTEHITCKDNFEFIYDECGDDVLIWFNEKYLKLMAELVKPRTAGKGISPFSNANLPKGDYKIPDDDLNKFTSIYQDLDKIEKMHYVKKVLSDYDDVIVSKKSKKILEARKESGLKPKEYIHYIGMWKDFLKFAKKEYNDR